MGTHRKHTAGRSEGQLAYDRRRAAAKADREAREARRKAEALAIRVETVIAQARRYGGIWYSESGDHAAIKAAVESGRLVRVDKGDGVMLVVDEPMTA